MSWKNTLIAMTVCLTCCFCTENPLPRICIIGGGMGGGSAAHFLRQHFGNELQIDLYESGELGGRLATVTINNQAFEAGGSIIHPKNQYMVNFTNMLGLKPRDPSHGGRMGLFDGQEMVFTTASNSYYTMAKLLWHYGLSVVYLQDYIDHSLRQFDRIYKNQEDGYAFSTPEKLIASMSPEFVNQLHQTTERYLSQRDYDQIFIDQFVMAALLTNYGQATDIHAFVGMVSLAGIQPGLWSVHGGNAKVPIGLVKNSNVRLQRAKVTEVTLLPNGKYAVTSDESRKVKTSNYDIVILAAPLETSGIELKNFPLEAEIEGARKFHRTIANFVHGQLNATYFGWSSQEELTRAILSTNTKSMFNSIGYQEPVDLVVDGKNPKPLDFTGDAVWKVFTKKPLKEEDFDLLFLKRYETKVVDWMAYPSYISQSSHEDLPKFDLHDYLCHANAIEWAASSMETSAIAGRNCALLAINRWEGKVDKIDSGDFSYNTGKKDEL